MIHQYKLFGRNVVLDIGSGSVHLVDEPTYDVIALYESAPKEEIIKKITAAYPDETPESAAGIFEEIEELKEQDKLFSKEDYSTLHTPHSTLVKALCLHMAHTCNLTCDYCFAKGSLNSEFGIRNSDLMPYEVGKQALDFLVANSGELINLEVDFFGGEPLINWDVIKQLVAYARTVEETKNKKFRFTLTTNGILLDDEVREFANREMDNVVLSLDGRKEVHDRFRRTVNGRGSYDIVVPKFQKFAHNRGDKSYYIRGTFTHFNTDFVQDILHMAALGFDKLSMEPVVCPPSDPSALTAADLPVLKEQYELLAAEMIKRQKEGRPFTFYHYMLDLKAGPCIHKRLTGCGAGSEYMAVTPWGELFPCHQFVGDQAFSMGDIWKGVTNTALREEMAGCTLYSREECRSCWAKLYCSGGCTANAYHAGGSVHGIYEYGCELFRKRMECAIVCNAIGAADEIEN